MKLAIRSDVGNRDDQQDRFGVAPGVVVVADGMGGRPGGGQAAQVAVAAVLSSLAGSGLGLRWVEEAAAAGNQAVQQLRLSSPEFTEAATTLTIVALVNLPGLPTPRAIVAHVGDSPAFLVRGGDTTLLTRPHTVAEEGKTELPRAATARHTATTLTRHLGAASLLAETTEVDLEEDDLLLVATDGLLDGTDPRRIRELATSGEPIDDISDRLAAEALRHRNDNVTLVVLDPFAPHTVSASTT